MKSSLLAGNTMSAVAIWCLWAGLWMENIYVHLDIWFWSGPMGLWAPGAAVQVWDCTSVQCPSIAICSRASACTVFPVRSTYPRLISAKKKRLPFETKYWCHAQLHHQTSSPCTAKQLKERWSMSNKSSLSPITSIIACSWPDQAWSSGPDDVMMLEVVNKSFCNRSGETKFKLQHMLYVLRHQPKW
jgi:hypothetical protein